MQRTPKLCRHKATGQHYVSLAGKRHYLGSDRKAAAVQFARLIAEWEASDRSIAFGAEESATVAVLVAQYLIHVESAYRRPDGSPGSEVRNITEATRPLLRLYGDLPVSEIDALKIEAVRESCIDHRWMTEADRKKHAKSRHKPGWCRGRLNQNLGRWKRMFRWGFTRKLVPLEVLEQVRAVDGLRVGRTNASEGREVLPVPVAIVDQTLPHLLPPVRAMVELQRLTGMRSGEVCALRPCDIDRTGEKLTAMLKGTPVDLGGAWVYLPATHKTSHRGHKRIVPIGPKAQALLSAFLDRPGDAHCFSPAEGLANVRADRRARRRTRVQPSQQNRRKRRPKKVPRTFYTPSAYAHSIAAVCKREGIPHWHPHQLRHAAAHALEDEFDYETARQVLGHRHVNTTKLYLRAAVGKAIEAMREAG